MCKGKLVMCLRLACMLMCILMHSSLTLSESVSTGRYRREPLGNASEWTDIDQRNTAMANTSGVVCTLRARKSNIYHTIRAIRSDGAHLIDYDIVFRNYDHSPLAANVTENYKAHSWQRVFSYHGRALLSLDFNYRVLSLQLLTFGVSRLSVKVMDTPQGCYGQLSEADKIDKLRYLIMNDFREKQRTKLFSSGDRVCRTVIVDDNGFADFRQECCRYVNHMQNFQCNHDVDDGWLSRLYILIAAAKAAFVMFGSLLLQRWLFNESVSQSNYVIALKENLLKTILVKKSHLDENELRARLSSHQQIEKFVKFRKLVKTVPSERVTSIVFHKMHLEVDERKLITEKDVPAGLTYFLYHHIFLFGICRHEPVASCCRASIFGDVCLRFCWLKLMRRTRLGQRCRILISWGTLMRTIWCAVLMALIPSPYVLRVVLYYLYEDAEVTARQNAADALNLRMRYGYNPLRYLTPTHVAMVTLYIGFATSFAALAVCRAVVHERYDSIVLGAVRDLRAISRLECLRLLAAHLLWPFERYGFCGVFVAAIYWPIALPLCALVLICYSVPTLYLSGRIFVSRRPPCLQDDPHAANRPPQRLRTTITGGVKSVEGCFLLENISPTSRTTETHRWGYSAIETVRSAADMAVICTACFVAMCCVLLMYAEVAGFLLEVCLLTFTGVVVNAGSAAKYAMLAFWVITYAMSCYNGSYKKYQQLNAAIFAYIKDKLNDDIRTVTLLREDRQKNVAFKYFSASDLAQTDGNVYDSSDDEKDDDVDNDMHNSSIVEKESPTIPPLIDSIEYIKGTLHWRVRSLVLYVDRCDVPRIPRTLFERICAVEAPGCPGPIHKSLLEATRRLFYMLTFLVFVFIVATAFGSSYDVSPTNQMLVTLAGGFLPFVVRFVLQPSQAQLDLNTYTFEGKINHVIRTFSQTWPAYDLAFSRATSPFAEAATESTDPPAFVDLVITIGGDNSRRSNIIRDTASGSTHAQDGADSCGRNSPRSAPVDIGVVDNGAIEMGGVGSIVTVNDSGVRMRAEVHLQDGGHVITAQTPSGESRFTRTRLESESSV